jgi:hypothetical protein
VGAPAFGTRSAGTKVVLYPALSSTSVDYAIGVDNGTVWYATPTTDNQHRWYAGTTNVATLSGTGNLSVVGTASAATPTASTHLATKAYVDSKATYIVPQSYERGFGNNDIMTANGLNPATSEVLATGRYKFTTSPFFQNRLGSNIQLRVRGSYDFTGGASGGSVKIEQQVHSVTGDGAAFPFYAYGIQREFQLQPGVSRTITVVDTMDASNYAGEIAFAQASGALNPWTLLLVSPIWVSFGLENTSGAYFKQGAHSSIRIEEVGL